MTNMTPQEYLDWGRDMSERMKKYEYHFTNADRIRSMTDEELASFLCTISNCCVGNCLGEKHCSFDNGNGYLEWLKEEATV